MQGTAQGGQQFGLVFRAESAVQQLRQGFLLQAAPAVGLAAGQDRHKGDAIRVRLDEDKTYDLSQPNDLPKEIETLILTIRSKYAYLYTE